MVRPVLRARKVRRKQRGAWIGWPGVADSDEEPIAQDEMTLCPVSLSADDIAD